METTRKIPQEEIILLDELQMQLHKRGIKATQKMLIMAAIRMLVANKEAAINFIQAKKVDNTKEMTLKFLQNAKKHNFGKKWLEEIDVTQ